MESLWLVSVAVAPVATAAIAAAVTNVVAIFAATPLPVPAVVTTAVVVIDLIIPTVASSIVIVVIPIRVAHVCPLLLVHKSIGFEGLQGQLLGLITWSRC